LSFIATLFYFISHEFLKYLEKLVINSLLDDTQDRERKKTSIYSNAERKQMSLLFNVTIPWCPGLAK